MRGRDFNLCVRCRVHTEGHWHHRRSRSVVDEHQHATCNGIWLCPVCHKWVHEHPFEARQYGWIVSRHSIPCEEPLFAQQHGWVLLGHDAAFTVIDDPRSA